MNILKVNNQPALKSWNGLVNELFNDLEQSMTPTYQAAKGISKPLVNILENAEGYHIELLGPGRKKENFSIKVEKNELTISYQEEKQPLTEGVSELRTEFVLGNFTRNFLLNETIDSNTIQAKYENGILKIFLPKKPEIKEASKVIDIK